MDKNTTKKEYLSVASVVSMIAVVFLHVNQCFWTYSSERYWKTANIIDALFYYAVPVFFMISGATLLDYYDRYDTKTFFARRVHKTVIPFLIWNTVGAAYALILGGVKLNAEFILNFPRDIITYKYVPVYWFFIPLFSVYLCMPLVAAIPKDRKLKLFTYAISISFVINYLLPFVCKFERFAYLPNVLSFDCGQGYIIYILLGYVISKIELKTIHRIVLYSFSIGAFLLHLFGTYIYSVNAGEVSKFFKGYTALPALIYSVGIFVFIKQVSQKNNIKPIRKLIEILDKYTFSVYLLHWFVIDFIVRLFNLPIRSIVYRLCMPFVVICICCFVTYVLRKTKLFRIMLP